MSVWFVTGSSRGLGAAIVREALERGHQVVATARTVDAVEKAHPDAGDRLLAVYADVTNERSLRDAVEAGLARFGRIDVVVNNAGYGLLGAVEEVSDDAARRLFDVNVFGVMNALRATLPTLREQRSGHVFNIGSLFGFKGSPAAGAYSASKFALEGLTEALQAELAPLGVQVTMVEPGGLRTDFLDDASVVFAPRVLDDYAATSGAAREFLPSYSGQQGDPAKAAKVLVDIAGAEDAPQRIQLGSDAVKAVTAKLDQVRAELEHWHDVSVSVDYVG